MVRPHFKVVWLSKNKSKSHGESKENKRQETILMSEQGWALLAQLGQPKAGLDVRDCGNAYLWCPNDLSGLWDRQD